MVAPLSNAEIKALEPVYAAQYDDSFRMYLSEVNDVFSKCTTNLSLENAQDGYIDYMDDRQVRMREKLEKFGRTQFTEVPMLQRRYTWREWNIAFPISRRDYGRFKYDPTNQYVRAGVNAWNREKNAQFLARFFATFWQRNPNGAEVQVAFPAANILAHDTHLYDTQTGTTGLTVSKLMAMQNLAEDNQAHGDVFDEYGSQYYIACTTRDLNFLKYDIRRQAKSDLSDKMVMSGDRLLAWGGFKFITHPGIPVVGANRRLPVWTPDAVGHVKGDTFSQVSLLLPDVEYNGQVYVEGKIDFLRLMDQACYGIDCAITPAAGA